MNVFHTMKEEGPAGVELTLTMTCQDVCWFCPTNLKEVNRFHGQNYGGSKKERVRCGLFTYNQPIPTWEPSSEAS
jgi:hypothetical protein